jgi:hypothetical protein
MTQQSSTKIINTPIGVNKKLEGIKFEDAFDTTVLASAEKLMQKNVEAFRQETENVFNALSMYFFSIDSKNVTIANYVQVGELAFSIKSRGGMGGYELASEVANSLYKFCDAAAPILPKEGYKILELHFNALQQVIEEKFPQNDNAKAKKLVSGLEQVSEKYTKKQSV